jgi:hypothetical protein
MPRTGGERAALAPAGHPAINQAGVFRAADLRAEAEAFHHPGAKTLDQRIRAHGRLLPPKLLAATQVSPANASRDPDQLRRDIDTIRALGLAFRPVSRPWLTLPVLRLERLLGISLTVWLRLGVLQLLGSARRVCLD